MGFLPLKRAGRSCTTAEHDRDCIERAHQKLQWADGSFPFLSAGLDDQILHIPFQVSRKDACLETCTSQTRNQTSNTALADVNAIITTAETA